MPVETKTVRRGLRSFFTEEVWPHSEEGQKTRWEDWCKFFTVVFNGFSRNRCPIRAAALSYNTLLALVPLLAVILGVSKGILSTQEDRLFDVCMQAIRNVAPQIGQAAVEEQALLKEKLHDALGAVNAGALGLVGSLMLVVTSISLFSTIEHTLNDIWGVPRGRS